MAEISNKTLAALMVVAIVISFIGMIGALKFQGIQIQRVTGAVTTTGTTKINITAVQELNVTDTDVDFGTGRLNAGISWCKFQSNGTATSACQDVDGAAVVDGETFSGLDGVDGFTIQNSGNTAINVSINASTAATFIGGGGEYNWLVEDGAANCAGESTSWTAFTASTQEDICGSLAQEKTFDVDIQLNVTSTSTTGERSDTVTFAAQSP